MRIITASDDGFVLIGKQGENAAAQVQFPVVEEWAQTYGAGVFQLMILRPTEATPYAVPVTNDGTNVLWTVGKADVAIPGIGGCELRYVVDGTVAKSQSYVTLTDKSIGGSEAPYPTPWEEWVDQVLDAAASAEADAGSAAASASAAQTAQGAAETAQTAAETAQAGAVNAKDAADTDAALALEAKLSAQTSASSAAQDASDAAASQAAAAASALSAESSADAASYSASAAQTAQGAAETAQTAAETAQAAAEAAEDTVAADAAAAAEAKNTAVASATAAATSEEAAAGSAISAASSAASALASQTAAASSETAAAGSAAAASGSASAAAVSATAAQTAQTAAETAAQFAEATSPAVYRQVESVSGTNVSNMLQIHHAADRNAKSVIVRLDPTQAGSGDPSPDNVRAITGHAACDFRWGKGNLYGGNTPNSSLSDSGVVTESSSNMVTDPIGVVGMSTVRVYYYNSSNGYRTHKICFYDADGAFITGSLISGGKGANSYATITGNVPSGAVTMRVSCYTTSYIVIQGDSRAISTIAFPQAAGTVYGGYVDITGGKLVVTKANIAAYAGETLPGAWISSMDVYAEGASPTTGAQVVYDLAEPVEYDITPNAIPLYEGDNILMAIKSLPNVRGVSAVYADGSLLTRSDIGEIDEEVAGKRLGTRIDGWIDGRYINTSGAIGSVVDIGSPGRDNVRYVVTDCAEGDIFTVSGRGGLSSRLWCFLDAENQIVSSAGPRSICTGYRLTAPSGSAMLILQQVNTEPADCYRGVSPLGDASAPNPASPYRTVDFAWEKGGIDGTGFITANDNIRSKGIFINPGETFVVTNTSQTYSMDVYACRDNAFSLLSYGYQEGVGQLIADDPTRCYYVRVKRNSGSTSIAASEGSNFTVQIVNNDYRYQHAGRQKYIDNTGFRRTYTYLNPMLTFARKDLEADGTLSDSTTRCVAMLPRNGCVEIRQQMYSGCFKVAKVAGSTVTYLVDDWSYYTYRYMGDGSSDYYLIAALSNATSSEITAEGASHRIAVYSYTDEGVRTEERWLLAQKKIAVIGDSITQGRFAKYGTTLNWTATKPFGALIAEQAGDDDYGNFGIGGALVYNSDWKSLYANCGKVSGYDVVFVCGGTNDYGNNVSEANFTDAYTYVIETLMANNTEVVICTPVYRESKTGSNSQGLTLYDYAVIEMNIAAAKELKAIDLYKLTNNQKFIRYLPDALHPNEIGHQMIADFILNEYQRLSI